MTLRAELVDDEHYIAERSETILLFDGHFVGVHHLFVATEGGREHEQGGKRHLEVGEHGVGHAEFVGREDKFARPSLIFLDASLGAHASLECALHSGAHGTDFVPCVFGAIHDFAAFGPDVHLFARHFVFGQVFHVRLVEASQTAVQGNVGRLDTFDLHSLKHRLAEVESGRGSGDCAFVAGEDALETFQVFGLGRALDDFVREWRFAQAVERLLELVVIAVIKEAQCASAAGGVVDHLGHDRIVLAEIEFVADADLASGVHEHIPEALFAIQFAQQKDFDARSRFFLTAIETGGKNLRVVEHKHVLIVEVFEEIFEFAVFDFARFAVQHEHAALVTVFGGIFCDEFFGEFELKLG